MVNGTMPLPMPCAVSGATWSGKPGLCEVASHAQPGTAVTEILPAPPLSSNPWLVGAIATTQLPARWTIVRTPRAVVTNPWRSAPPLTSTETLSSSPKSVRAEIHGTSTDTGAPRKLHAGTSTKKVCPSGDRFTVWVTLQLCVTVIDWLPPGQLTVTEPRCSVVPMSTFMTKTAAPCLLVAPSSRIQASDVEIVHWHAAPVLTEISTRRPAVVTWTIVGVTT